MGLQENIKKIKQLRQSRNEKENILSYFFKELNNNEEDTYIFLKKLDKEVYQNDGKLAYCMTMTGKENKELPINEYLKNLKIVKDLDSKMHDFDRKLAYVLNNEFNGDNLLSDNDIVYNNNPINEKIDGKYYLIKKDDNNRNPSISIKTSNLKSESFYTLSFKTKLSSGVVSRFGGHFLISQSQQIKINNEVIPNRDWYNGFNFNHEIDKVNEFIINFKTKTTEEISSVGIKDFYIQPNRNGINDNYELYIYDIKLTKGTRDI